MGFEPLAAMSYLSVKPGKLHYKKFIVPHVKQVFLLVIVDENRQEGLKQKILLINLHAAFRKS